MCAWDNGIPNLIYSYFSNLFQSNGGSDEAIIANVQSRVTAGQNLILNFYIQLQKLNVSLGYAS